MRSPLPWILLSLALGAAFLWREAEKGHLRDADLRFGGWAARQAGPGSLVGNAHVTLVAIDALSLASHPDWPWQPLDYVLFFKAALPCSPSVLGVVPVLRWEKEVSAYREVLLDYALKAPKLVLAAGLGRTRDPGDEPTPLPVISKVSGDVDAVPEFSAVLAEPSGDLARASLLGSVNLPGGVLRPPASVPLVLRYRGDLVATFPLQALLLWKKLSPQDIEVRLGESIRLPGTEPIPIDRTGSSLINPTASRLLRKVSYADLILKAAQKETEGGNATADIPAGEVILIGRTLPEVTLDPPETASAEQIAVTVAALQSGAVLREIPRPAQLGASLFLVCLAPLLWRLARINALLVTCGVAAGYALVAVSVAGTWGVVLPAVAFYAPLLILAGIRMFLQGRRDEL